MGADVERVVHENTLDVLTSLRGVSEYFFTSLSAQSWQYRDRSRPEAGTMPYSYFECEP